MDEASKELHAHARAPPCRPLREDDKYERHGTRAIFMFFAPLLGWRRTNSREHHTRIVAEIELSFLSRQCLDRRISDAATLDQELDAWNRLRNEEGSKIHWQFTTPDARI